MDESQKSSCKLVVPRCDPTKLFELGKQTFDAVPFAVRLLVQRQRVDGVAAEWNHRNRALAQKRIADLFTVVSFVGNCFLRMAIRWHRVFQFLHDSHIVLLARSQHKGDGRVLIRRRDVQFGGESTAASSQSLAFLSATFFEAPAA